MYNRHVPPDSYAISLRTAQGKRHSTTDQAHLDKAHELLDDAQAGNAHQPRAATLRTALQIAAAAPARMRAAIPDSYNRPRHLAASDVSPEFDPRYEPLGAPADGYLLARAAKVLAKEVV